ncbi:hypothetical protein VE02_06728 [Pseudogymnoascus sp. 03VT05]|nr:hypothetical protein VE02_06728 [Pseudogymnoascus sp. 03VT05]
MPATTTTPSRKFELPVLAPLDSLTAGTDIPPPPDSPIAEAPPPPPKAPSAISTTSKPEDEQSRGREPGSPTNGLLTPMSMTSPRRPGSIRRFLSRRSLNGSVPDEGAPPARPVSSLSMAPTSGQKRSGSWWRRFVGDSEERERKRTSVVYEDRTEKDEPAAPSLPEISALGVKSGEQEGLDGDMFKNIK